MNLSGRYISWGEILIKHVVKRSGEVEAYDRTKIYNALTRAFAAVEGKRAFGESEDPVETITRKVEELIEGLMAERHPHSIPAIEEIQDLVENALIETRQTAVAKAYILYRARHEAIRDVKKLMLDIDSTMNGYLRQSDWRVNENANVNYSLGGLILHNSGSITANYWLKNIYTPEIADAHRNADFHIHDLAMFSGYCAGWSLRQLIAEGLGGVSDKITSKPAKHLSTLMQQAVNFLGCLQNEWAGAQAFSSFDTYIAPFVRADRLSDRELKQCLQSFVFGVNTPSRWGSQAPFTNITLDWTVPADLRDKKAVIGGVEADFTYGDCKAEMDRVNRIFIELMLEGDANGRGFQYPIPTYNITGDFDWEGENARLLFEMTSRYGTPYFQNFVNSDLDPGDVRSMCCRLRLDKRELRKRGGGLFGSDELTGSIGVVTINLPRIGYLAENEEDFFRRLSRLMELAKESLLIKRKAVNRFLDSGLFPYTRRYLTTLDNHFNTIGLVGMNECIRNFLGAGVNIATERGRRFALEVLQFMRNKLADFQEETGELFNLEATPAESTSYRLAKHDKSRYPNIITAGGGENGDTGGSAVPYYTNSTQLPVMLTDDIFDALDLQEELQTVYTGGTVFHVFLGEAIEDWRSCRDLVKAVACHYRIPYFTISPTFSVCPIHGYLKGEHFTCPRCREEEIAPLRRRLTELEREQALALETLARAGTAPVVAGEDPEGGQRVCVS
ncbi:MAG: ribonucleoside triphosphate reductase [Spirochaetaceae bacterium]|jgi:ribonucleoside-triphosphate reductase|nr:ribonucleoside triphosphate reductase [Spirochaetaceae bacterium]